MRHPVTFTFLGFHFNAIIDEGHSLDLRETHQKIKEKSLFPWLVEKFGHSMDISLFTEKELDEIVTFFSSLSDTTDEDRKMGVRNNGLCLLVAYCFEGAQRKIEDIR